MSSANDFIIENGVLIKYVGPGGDVVIPESVTVIGKNAFRNCEELLQIILPEGITSIETGAFGRCLSLETVVLPKTLMEIGTSAFSACGALTSINVPENITRIGDGAFQYCKSLKSILLSEGIKKIGKRTFMACDLSEKLTIPKTVKTIADFAFSDTDFGGEYCYHSCACPLLTILGSPKISDLAFGSSAKRSAEFAPPIWFADMLWADIPKPYKRAGAEGFIVMWNNNADIADEQKAAYLKYLKSQRKKYYARLVKEPKLLYLFLTENILSREDVTALIDSDSNGISVEIKALLLEYSSYIQ